VRRGRLEKLSQGTGSGSMGALGGADQFHIPAETLMKAGPLLLFNTKASRC
jgi:hypothetical protein